MVLIVPTKRTICNLQYSKWIMVVFIEYFADQSVPSADTCNMKHLEEELKI